VFAELNKYALSELPGMILGVGSVVDGATASLYMQLGANFIVSPVLKEDMAVVCNRRKVLWAPGCGSLNEISRAEELGAEIVKIFPAKQVGGPDFVKAVKAPCPWSSIMPTGGVEPEEENLRKWFDAGVVCVGLGSNLVNNDVIKNNSYEDLAKKVKGVLEIIKKVRNK
jgi:2-dehydro-3-deoxyphosphogluconate aldolase/(4S)-4-hydroxy-2-oxoglutarate aldolase